MVTQSEDCEIERLTWEMLGSMRNLSTSWGQALEPIQVLRHSLTFEFRHGSCAALHLPAQKAHFHMEISVLHKIHRFGSSSLFVG